MLPDHQSGSLLGPAFTQEQVKKYLREQSVVFHEYNDETLMTEVTNLLLSEKVIGWFQGRMEYGPRALGARSIIGDARSTKMQSIMNLKIKYRESFRPFAPIVLREHASAWFEIQKQHESPYMLIVADVSEQHKAKLTAEQETQMHTSLDLCERVNIPRSTIPAVTHVDHSGRLQTVDEQRNLRLHALMSNFFLKTGCPVLVNTSFNVRGEPIVCTPEDAFRCFMATEMDALVIENCVILKEENTHRKTIDKETHLAQFQLD